MRSLLPFCFALLAGPVAADQAVVFAAASLKEPLDQIAEMKGDVVVSYGGSGALARQVLQGAPADLVLLANAAWMQELEDVGRIDAAADFASNRLVVLGPADAADLLLNDLPLALGDGRLAMGFTQAVPAGIYGRAALENLGLWDRVSPQVVEVDNVRAALALVARGEATYGITYATDARVSDAVRVVAQFDTGDHPAIRYRGGLTSNHPAARAFWDYLQGEDGQAALAAAGFVPPEVR